jgi:hypothetical protein
MKAVASRFARAVQRVFGLEGSVVFGRYAIRILATQREVRHALRYVLLNDRKHWFERFGEAPPLRLDDGACLGREEGSSTPLRACPRRDAARRRPFC